MTLSESRTRFIGVSLADVSDWSHPLPAGKWSQFFGALAAEMSLVDIVRPQLSAQQRYVHRARTFRPSRHRWRMRGGFSLGRVALLDAMLETELRKRSGTYDLIVQLQTLCSPRGSSVTAPYVIYTDSTMAVTQRIYPPIAPLPAGMMRDWLAFEARVCRDAQAVFTYSEFARHSVIDDYSCPPERVVAVGAGANQLVTSIKDKDYSRPRVLFVGKPFKPKGGRVLLAAWRLVTAQIPEAELIIVGPKYNPILGRRRGITWLGRLSRNELAVQYAAASVFVLPSFFDAWGHVFVEAMAYGLPCVGSDCCAMPEIIDDGVSGLVVPRGEPEPLAQAMIALLSDRDRAARMGQAGRHRVLESMTWAHVANRVVSHLKHARPDTDAVSQTARE